MPAKRMLIFAGYFLPHVGGYELSLYQLFIRMAKMGYEITVVTCNTERAPVSETIGGLLIHRLPCWNILGGAYPIPRPGWSTFRILRKLSREHYDLVQTNTRFFLTSLLGFLFSKLKRIPLIHVELGSRHTVLANPMVDKTSKAYDHTLGALVVRSASKVVCSSHAAEDFLKHLGVKGQIAVIPTAGVDTSVFSDSKRPAGELRKAEIGLGGSLVVTSVCRLIYAKGIQDLISAFPRIKQKVPNVRVLIVGDGPYRSRLEELARKTDPDGILFLGQLGHQDVARVFAMTDVLVHPSYSEALIALPVLEAGAMGVPSVTTDAGGVREVIEDGKTGLIVRTGNPDDLAERVVQLLQDRQLREEIGRRIQELVTGKYSFEGIVSAYSAEIESEFVNKLGRQPVAVQPHLPSGGRGLR
jgi:glycosyltransferase involved in cell wall biosynthesis